MFSVSIGQNYSSWDSHQLIKVPLPLRQFGKPFILDHLPSQACYMSSYAYNQTWQELIILIEAWSSYVMITWKLVFLWPTLFLILPSPSHTFLFFDSSSTLTPNILLTKNQQTMICTRKRYITGNISTGQCIYQIGPS